MTLSLSLLRFGLLDSIKVLFSGFGDGTEELFINDGLSIKEEQRQRLLNNSERLERTGNQLLAGYRAVIETEEVGNQVLQDLAIQRETIQRARSRVSG